MKQERNKGLNYFGWRSTTFTMLVALIGFASVAGATYSLPASRSVTWQGNVGVKGDIPSRATIYKTLSPTGGDDTSAIKTAIANCPTGQVVKLDAGTFNVSSAITVKSGITLRGSGMGKTIIKGKAGTTGTYLVGMKSSSYSLSTSIALSSGLTKGSTTITTATAHNWIAGDIVLMDQLNNAQDDPPVNSTGKSACTWCGRSSGTRSMGQLVKIVAVPSSTSATLELPLYWDYDRTLTPQGTKLNGVTRDAGVEDLTIDNMLSASSSQGSSGGTIVLTGNSNCWLLRVEAIGSIRPWSGSRQLSRHHQKQQTPWSWTPVRVHRSAVRNRQRLRPVSEPLCFSKPDRKQPTLPH